MNYELDSKMPALLVLMGAQLETLRMLNLNTLQEVKDRLSFCYHIKGLKASEVENYLETRLKWAGAKHPLFPADIAQQMGRHAQWIPRRINRLAGPCLLAAAIAKRSLIDQDCLDQAVSEMQFQPQKEEE
jgi:type II secretory pathway predicted ATPase ExeA